MSIQERSEQRDPHTKLLLICAHRWEAKPFLQLASLKPLTLDHLPFQIFCNETSEHWLLISGQGSLRSSASTAATLAHLSPCSDALVVANFGFAAADSRHHPLGSVVLGNKVTDHNSDDCVYPERILKAPWEETEIITAGKPLVEPLRSDSASIYDMEASAVYAAAELFLSTSQMVVGKFISDHLDGRLPNWADLRNQHQDSYTQSCSEFFRFALAHQEHLSSDSRREAAEAAEKWWSTQSERLSSEIGLSVTQTRQLRQTLRALALSKAPEGSLQAIEDEILYLLDEFGELSQKHDRLRALEKIQQLALSPLEFET